MDSEYVTMYTHGFLYGYLKDIDNERLTKLALKNYENRVSDNPNDVMSEVIPLPFDKEIKKIIEQMSDAYEKHFGKRLQKNTVNGDHYWSQVHYKEESCQYHRHLAEGTELAGVYYVNIPKGSGDLIIRYKKHDYDYSDWYFPPETGKFIIFNSGLEHAVSRNRSEDPRICIAFNFKIVV
jgi:uncharacterized protein (TIGR02466 family)